MTLACAGSGGPRAPSLVATVITPSGTPANPTAAAAPTLPASPTYAIDAPSGVVAIDPVVEAVTRGKLTKLLGLTRTFSDPCFPGLAEGLAQACAPGETPATLIDTFIVEICTGGYFIRAAEMAGALRPITDGSLRLFAVFEIADNRLRKNRASEARGYVLIFRTASIPAQAVVAQLDGEGRLFAVSYGCGESPERTVSQWANSGGLLLPPPAR